MTRHRLDSRDIAILAVRDVEAYQALMDPLLELRVGLKRYFSYIVTKEVKFGGALPFGALLGANGSA